MDDLRLLTKVYRDVSLNEFLLQLVMEMLENEEESSNRGNEGDWTSDKEEGKSSNPVAEKASQDCEESLLSMDEDISDDSTACSTVVPSKSNLMDHTTLLHSTLATCFHECSCIDLFSLLQYIFLLIDESTSISSLWKTRVNLASYFLNSMFSSDRASSFFCLFRLLFVS